jgi:hypothetical protein
VSALTTAMGKSLASRFPTAGGAGWGEPVWCGASFSVVAEAGGVSPSDTVSFVLLFVSGVVRLSELGFCFLITCCGAGCFVDDKEDEEATGVEADKSIRAASTAPPVIFCGAPVLILGRTTPVSALPPPPLQGFALLLLVLQLLTAAMLLLPFSPPLLALFSAAYPNALFPALRPSVDRVRTTSACPLLIPAGVVIVVE